MLAISALVTEIDESVLVIFILTVVGIPLLITVHCLAR